MEEWRSPGAWPMAVAVVGVSLALIYFQCEPTLMYPYRCTLGILRVLQEPPEPSGMWEQQLLPGHRHRVIMVWPHTVCPMPAAGLKPKHCLAVMAKKNKCPHYSDHSQWQLWVQNYSLGLEVWPLIVLAPFWMELGDPLHQDSLWKCVQSPWAALCCWNWVLIHSKWFEATVACSKFHFAADLRLSCSLSRAHLYNLF